MTSQCIHVSDLIKLYKYIQFSAFNLNLSKV